MSLKIFVCGDLNGNLDDLYKRISTIEKKSGKFDNLFCIGNVFGESDNFLSDYIAEKKFSTIETFFICSLPTQLSHKIDPKGSQICKNVTYLGEKGVMKFQNKLHIAFLHSIDVQSVDVRDLSSRLSCTNFSYSGIDLLFTSEWPIGIELADDRRSISSDSDRANNSELIGALASLCQPRYHFSAGNQSFYERPPYKNQKNNLTKPKHVTRFIGLASFKNDKNEKYLYAMQIKPMDVMDKEELLQIPSNSTDNPFLSLNTDSVLSSSKQQFFYDLPDRKRKAEDKSEENEKRKRSNTSDGCWFCLGNPEVEKHLIVHIGEEVYLAMPRGPLIDDHFMILTIGHYQSFIVCPKQVAKEIKNIMKKISRYFSSIGKSVVFFERNFKSNHFQMQVVPIDTDKLEICKNLFEDLAKTNYGPGDNFREIPSRTKLDEVVKPNVPYFYTEFSDGTRFFGSIPRSQLSSFDLQYGRIVLSNKQILNCPEKIQWKNCIQDRDEEEKMVRDLKSALKGIL